MSVVGISTQDWTDALLGAHARRYISPLKYNNVEHLNKIKEILRDKDD